MDAWKEYAAWVECRNSLRDWADLEAKSATMSEDLYREFVPQRSAKRTAFVALESSAHIVAWAIEVWRMFRSG